MIRAYHAADLPELMEVFKSNTPRYFAASESTDLERYLDDHGGTYLVCVNDGNVIGGAGYVIREKDNLGLVTWIFLRPEASGRGLGRKLVEQCLAHLRRNSHVDTIRVNTSQHAFRFFEKFGFKIILKEEDHWAPGLDLYRMEM